MNAELVSAFELSWSEKLQLVQDLWDDLASSPEQVPIPEGLIDELDRRKANYQQDPGTASSWEDVKKRIRARYGR